ncbi:MAG: Asp-tRNA(Asn)/Glu-tRNA(Gln) amidotransferase subunit GatC [Angelakisella sp.]|jgi:aspartyl-tRNA(Asn)/glutamyl-tRNA(Gln) amidotransferase subunit C|nr:Asp-tRNA(Asn)/Glu-tRNA(Gln) amidotransferase subunit GatC [Angelakisella sp.]
MNIDIKHIAKLSRLSIDGDKVEKFQREMENIVAMVEKLPAVENQTLAVDPADRMELRKDEIRPSLRREVMLQNAPKAVAGCIVVPKTVE